MSSYFYLLKLYFCHYYGNKLKNWNNTNKNKSLKIKKIKKQALYKKKKKLFFFFHKYLIM